MPEKVFQFLGRGCKEHPIPFFKHEIAGRNDRLPASCHGADQHFDAHASVQRGKLHPRERVFLADLVLDKFYAAFGKGFDLQRIRKTQNTRDLAGDRFLRVDHERKSQL